MNSFYNDNEIALLGFKSYGENVLLSKKCSIYKPEQISIGNDVRIDDFCILSGNITFGNNIHISAFVGMFGGKHGIEIKDYSTISSRTLIYAINDDYSGNSLTNPTVPIQYRKIIDSKVVIQRHVIVGSGSIILPGVDLAEGSSFGAMSLIVNDSEPWSINVGIPAKKRKDRSKELLKFENELMKEVNKNEK